MNQCMMNEGEHFLHTMARKQSLLWLIRLLAIMSLTVHKFWIRFGWAREAKMRLMKYGCRIPYMTKKGF